MPAPGQGLGPTSSVAGSPTTKAGKRRTVSPLGPKRPSNAYMFFCRTRREDLRKEQPDLAFAQIGAEMGVSWQALSQEERVRAGSGVCTLLQVVECSS